MVLSNTLIIRLTAIFALVAAGFVSGGVTPLQAQYFGRNQVQYKTFGSVTRRD